MYDHEVPSPIPSQEDKPLPTGTRARSKERNRLKILESAIQLFRERGFEAATLRDIARSAGLSTGALFANFTDKTEIFLTVVGDENARVVQVMREAHDANLPLTDRLKRQMMRAYEVSQVNARLILSAFVMKWSQESLSNNEVGKMSDLVRYALRDTLKMAQDRGELPAGVTPDTAAEILEDLLFANLRRAFQGSDEQGSFDMDLLSQRVTEQVAVVVAGLKACPGK